MSALDPKLANEIAEYANGTCKSEAEIAEAFSDRGVTDDQIMDACIAHEVERCGLCDWWDELSNFNSNGNCLDCEPDDGQG